MRPSKREEIVEKALEIFRAEGFRAAGMDALAARIGVSKTSIYNNFPGKDGLILAALDLQEARMEALLDAHEARTEGPRERLLSVFDALAEWFASPGFAGCAFQRAAAEFQAPGHPVREMAAARKRALAARFAALARAARAEAAGPAISMLVEGAIVAAAIGLAPDPAGEAKRAAAALVDAVQARGSSRSTSESQ